EDLAAAKAEFADTASAPLEARLPEPDDKAPVTPSLVDRFDQMLASSRLIASALSVEAIHAAVLDAIEKLLRPEACMVLVVDEGSTEPRVAQGRPGAFDYSHTLVQHCLSSGRTVVLGADQAQLAVSDSALLAGLRSALCVPIQVRGRVAALVYAQSRQVGQLLGPVEEKLAETVAAVAGAALENADGFARILAAQQELQETQERLRAVLGAAPIVLVAIDRAGKIILVEGRGLLSLRDVNPAVAIGRNIDDIYPGVEWIREDLRRVLDGEEFVGEGSIGEVHFQTTYAPLRDAGGAVIGGIGVAVDITELKQAQREQRELSVASAHAQEDERRRLALALHDGAGQSLVAVALRLADLQRDATQQQHERMGQLQDLVARIIEDVRGLSHDLRPGSLDKLGLSAALQDLASSASTSQCKFELRVSLDGPTPPPEVGIALFRIAQTAVGNVLRHSNAKAASIALSSESDSICLEIEDDGDGFDQHLPRSHTGLGLIGMRERVTWLGGKFTVRSSPGNGTRISVEVPLTATGRAPSRAL
ncbi:MAG: PAS domain-containing protein, partial [Deltaproteobacteria bacterium]|nr:PAS domain-containing protein [Deltaproteobacteria bacterium]